MVASMASGSVIVDLAAAGGGNCDLTQAGEVITTDNGVTVIGYYRYACTPTRAGIPIIWHQSS